MKPSFGDAMGSALDALREFRWPEYAPFFWILAAQWVFLALATQLQHDWAMSIVAPIARALGAEQNIHYPMFFGGLSVLAGWIEAILYTVPGAVLIPLMLLRFYSRRDRALSLGAGASSRLAAAFLPTLVSGALAVITTYGWQLRGGPVVTSTVRGFVQEPFGGALGWLLVTLGSFAITTLLLYVPVAAVQAKTNSFRAFGYGVRFGFRSWPHTISFAVLFGIPSILIQYVLERHGAAFLSRLRPDLIVVFLAIYVTVTNLATYFTYGAAARFYRLARGEE